jgi:hypothetical protein
MLLLHVSAPIRHLYGNHLQRNTLTVNVVKNIMFFCITKICTRYNIYIYIMYIKDPYTCFDSKLSSSGGSSQRNTRTLHQQTNTIYNYKNNKGKTLQDQRRNMVQ